MPRYFFLYADTDVTKNQVFKFDGFFDSEQKAREYFRDHYNSDLLAVRKGLEFTQAEIDEKRRRLKMSILK